MKASYHYEWWSMSKISASQHIFGDGSKSDSRVISTSAKLCQIFTEIDEGFTLKTSVFLLFSVANSRFRLSC